MIRLGLCSGACITRDIKSVVALASAARLDAIEWSADVHIGAQDLSKAGEAMMATLMAGLTTVSYATLYRAGTEEGGFPHFDALLKVASALQAPIMRIFACAPGSVSRDGAGGEGRNLVLLSSVLRQLGDRAAERGITLCLSMGRGTCLDNYERAAELAGLVGHDFVRLAWEDLPGSPAAQATAGLACAGKYASLLIARCARRDGESVAIAANEEAWLERIRLFRLSEMDPKMGSFILLAAARPEGRLGDDSLAADAQRMRDLVTRAD